MTRGESNRKRWVVVPKKASRAQLGAPALDDSRADTVRERKEALRSERSKLDPIRRIDEWLTEAEARGAAKRTCAHGSLLGVGLTAVEMDAEEAERLDQEVADAIVVADRRIARVPATLQGAPADAPKSRWHLEALEVDRAHAKSNRGAGTRIAVLDSGVEGVHRELVGRVTAYEMGSGGRIVSTTADDRDARGHGTHVAGLAAGKTTGVAPEAEVISLRVIENDAATLSEIVTDWVYWIVEQANAQVVSMSLGLPAGEFERPQIDALDAATEALFLSGVLPVVASGNGGVGAPMIPGALPKVLSVGATIERRTVWGASSSGRAQLDPVTSVQVPTCTAPGVFVWSSVPGGKYDAFSGTSQAAPLAAGLAALARVELGGNPGPGELRDALLAKAAPLDLAPGDRQGHGQLLFFEV